MRTLSKFFFYITGWEVVGEKPTHSKYVMVAAPHSSNWDFIYARAAFFILKLPVRFTIKEELFFFPLGNVLRALGGIPINRKSKEGGMVEYMVGLFKEKKNLVVLVTPEGTRSQNPQWKKGFYYVALGAEVPIVLGYLDYKNKHAGIGPTFFPTGSIDQDMGKMKSFYRSKNAKHSGKGVK